MIDTNVLVSGFLSSTSPPARVLNALRDRLVTPVVSKPVLSEYHVVLHRPVLRLNPDRVDEVLSALAEEALHVELFPLDPEGFPDPSDVPFYATAMTCLCPLVTGNLKHFPNDGPVLVLSPREAVERLHLG